MEYELVGDRAVIIALANTKNATPDGMALKAELKRSAQVVAGANNHRYLRPQGNRGVESACLVSKAGVTRLASRRFEQLFPVAA